MQFYVKELDAEFKSCAKYDNQYTAPDGALVKQMSASSDYDLGRIRHVQTSDGKIISEFIPCNKEIYDQHNNRGKTFESIGLAVLDFGRKALVDTAKIGTWAEKHGGLTQYLPKSFYDYQENMIDNMSEKAHNWLRNNAPYEKTFDVTSVLSDIIATTCSIEALCKCAPALIGKGLNAFNGGKKLTKEGEKAFSSIDDIVNGADNGKDTQALIRERVIRNIEESKNAREASGYKEWADSLAYQGVSNHKVQELIGHDFEDYLTKKIGGEGSFSKGGRDFDGGVGNRWWESSYISKFRNDFFNLH